MTDRRDADACFQAALLDAVGQAVIATDPAGRIRFWNRAAEALYGWTASEVMGQSARHIFAGELTPGAAQIRARLDAGEPWSGEFTVRRKDGSTFVAFVTDTPIRDTAGALIGTVGVSTDLTAMRRVEDRLRSSEALLAESQRITQIGSWEWDIATDLIRCSDEQSRLFGLELGALVTVPRLMEVVHPDDRDRMECLTVAALQSDAHFEYDFRVMAPENSLRTLHCRGLIIRDDAGQPIRVIGTNQDVTESRAAQAALRESEERYRALVELAPDGITVRREDRLVFANEAAARLFGASSPSELVGVSTVDLTAPQCRPALLKRIATLRSMGTVVNSPEERLLRLDGTPFFAEIASVSTMYEGLPAVQSIIRDISARKSTEADLRREALVFEMIGDAVIVMDPDRVIVDWNPAAERIFGYTRAEMLGRKPTQLYPPADAGRQEEIVAALRERGRWGGELGFVRKDGSEGFGDVLIVVQTDVEGRLISTIGVTRDITERKTAQEALRRSEERLHLSQRLEAVGQLAGGVAHDFNNLLTAITSYTHLLLDDALPNDPRRDDLLEIKKAADRATSLTRQLLAFSRKQVLQPRVLDVNAVVADLEKMLRRLIGEHIALVTDCHLSLARVHADPGQLEQVIINLAVNARDAMPNGGTLRIRTSNVELTPEHWRGHPDVEPKPGRYVLLTVSDTGIGMDGATQARIFEPFFTTKGPGKGTGLGLSTVYGIVKQSGGYIWVHSEPAKGATFRIYLPAVERPAEHGPDGVVTAATAPNGSGTILLVEDETAVRALARRVLEQAGYLVMEASNGIEAEQVAARHTGPLDLVVTDVVMPNLGGKALAERLRAARPGLNVLFISGYPEGEIDSRGLAGEGISYLEKPFSPQVLRQRVRQAIGHR